MPRPYSAGAPGTLMRNNCNNSGPKRNERGVALIIVLLVTALLIALVFEFAYGTRISLRGAVNFRDNERAYYLARSGVTVAGLLLSDLKKKQMLQDYLQQDLQDVPGVLNISDAGLKIGWQDEGGKIDVSTVTKTSTGYARLGALFEIQGIDRKRLDDIADWQQREFRKFYLVTELHQFLSDAEFDKIQNFVTTMPVTQIDINTASLAVLQSIGVSAGMAEMIVSRRETQKFKNVTEINDMLGPSAANISGLLTITSDTFKVFSFATVGGFTKKIEAIIVRRADGSGADVKFMQELLEPDIPVVQ